MPDRRLNLTASPFNWMDASIFYVDITGRAYGPGSSTQSYKDKGFNFKLQLKDIGYFPAIAFGVNDLAGTNIYGSEYFVFSNFHNRWDYSLGVGWGQYSEGLSIKNPLIKIDPQFQRRVGNKAGRGGALVFGKYFSGENMSLFGAIRYKFNEKISLISELDPTSMRGGIRYSKPTTRINIGAEYKTKNFGAKISLLRGNEFSFQVTLQENFLSYGTRAKSISRDINTYEDLQRILALNQIGLVRVSSNKDTTKINIKQNSYLNQYEPNEIVYLNSSNISKGKSKLIIQQETLGMEVIESTYPLNRKVNIRNDFIPPQKEEMTKDFIVLEKYPILINSISPRIRTMIAAREGFLYQGILIEDDLEVIFNENFLFKMNLKHSISDNFDGLYIKPVNTFPAQVRSDTKSYLKNFDKGIIVGRLEFDYYQAFQKKHFFRASVGLFEEMFGGFGVDYLYSPKNSIFSLGLESYIVRKRDYNMKFGFLNYQNSFMRGSINIAEPKTDIRLRLSFGEYLAGDKGYTLELARRFDNGIEFGAFFTITDVSAKQFGEGSFDKGVKLKIPFPNLFSTKPLSKNRALGNFEWHPLTKDPGAMLIKSHNLRDEIDRFRVY